MRLNDDKLSVLVAHHISQNVMSHHSCLPTTYFLSSTIRLLSRPNLTWMDRSGKIRMLFRIIFAYACLSAYALFYLFLETSFFFHKNLCTQKIKSIFQDSLEPVSSKVSAGKKGTFRGWLWLELAWDLVPLWFRGNSIRYPDPLGHWNIPLSLTQSLSERKHIHCPFFPRILVESNSLLLACPSLLGSPSLPRQSSSHQGTVE